MALATLSIDIVAKLASLEAGLSKAASVSAATAAKMDARWAQVGGTFTKLGSIIGGTFATQQVLAFVTRTVDGLDKLNDVADVTGASIENISALEDIGARTGTGIETIEGALIKLNAQLKEADGKNGASLALKQIGLEAEQLKKVDPAQALLQVATALSGFADDGDKARLVQELFGKSVREVGPLLKELASAGTLNATVTTKQAQEAEKLNKQLLALQKNLVDASRAVSGPMVESLNDLIEKFKEGSKQGDGFLANLFSAIKSEADKNEARILGEQIDGLTKDLSSIEAKLKAFRTSGQSKDELSFFARGSVERLESDSTRIRGELRQLNVDLARYYSGAAGAGRGFVVPDTPLPNVGDEATKSPPKALSEAQRYLENLQKQAEQTLRLNNYEQALRDIQKARIEGLTPALERQILVQAALNDSLGKTLEVESRLTSFRQSELEVQASVEEAIRAVSAADRERVAEYLKGNKALAEEIELLGLDEAGIAAVETARLRSARSMKEEQRARLVLADASGQSAQQLDAEIAALKERERLINLRRDVVLTIKAKDEALDQNSDFTRRAAENIQDELGGALFSVYKGDFENIARGWDDLLFRMVSEAQAAELNKALFGQTVGGQGNGILGSLISAGVGFFTGYQDSIDTSGTALPTGDFSRMDRVPIVQAAEGIQRVPYDGFIAQLHKDEKVVPAKYRDSGSQVVNNIAVNNQSADVQASASARPNGTGGADIEVTIKRIARQAVAEDVGSGGTVDRAMRTAYGLGRQTQRRS